jgi:DNA-binding MarR family transcriptional regulator
MQQSLIFWCLNTILAKARTMIMKIEQEINQTKPFRNSWHKAAVNMHFTSKWMQQQMKALFKPYGVTMQQYNVLRILRGAGKPISTSVIRERLLDKMADTSRLVERLTNKGLVLRQECSEDKRLVDISLSEEGYDLLARMDVINNGLDGILQNLTEDEARQLSDLLDKARG